MKKKLALILISLDECFTKSGFSGGGHKVTKQLVLGLVESGLFDIDIYCKKAAVDRIDGINSINVLGKKNFAKKLKEKIDANDYYYVLSSDILLPFANNLIHSNSSKQKSKTGKSPLMQQILKIYNQKKIKAQEKCFINNKRAIFTVSESLKNDYVSNFNLDKKKAFVCHPAVDDLEDFVQPNQRKEFVIGSIVGGGLNKGGYLLLFALKTLDKSKVGIPAHASKIKARVIFPKIHKSGFFKTFVKVLGLEGKVEILPKQSDMTSYYKSIDCYVLPSLNEAFGLVVTEAASNFKPSIVSSTTGVRELVQDGKNGFVFDREKSPVNGLAEKIKEVSDIYFNNYDRYIQISKEAQEIPKRLDWKKFSDTIINNMVGEKTASTSS